MIVIAKKFGTYVFPGNNHSPKENLNCFDEQLNFFFPKEPSCPQKEGVLSPLKTWLFFGVT
jgi:hypothetical protein